MYVVHILDYFHSIAFQFGIWFCEKSQCSNLICPKEYDEEYMCVGVFVFAILWMLDMGGWLWGSCYPLASSFKMFIFKVMKLSLFLEKNILWYFVFDSFAHCQYVGQNFPMMLGGNSEPTLCLLHGPKGKQLVPCGVLYSISSMK